MSGIKIKHTIRLSPEISMQMADYARRKRKPQAIVVEAALASFLSADGSDRLEAAIGRRLDRMNREMQRQGWQAVLNGEALALFVHAWMLQNPALPPEARRASLADANARWQGYVEALADRMEAGPRLIDEIGQDFGQDMVPDQAGL
ncbi:CopG family transcriptional regulator [Sphingobium sp.]|uniref:CopG family transcriptional regulator n=1 Tax=Sphingobium sp. TaxID=1912891 RepID=UPI003B3B74F3